MEDFQTTHVFDGEGTIADTIIEALATAQGQDPTELDPVYTVVDLEAVERVIQSVRESMGTVAPGHLQFTIDAFLVTVAYDGTITVASDEKNGDVVTDR